MTDEYDNRSVQSLLRDLIANQHSLYEDIQDIHEQLTRIEERLEQAQQQTSQRDAEPAPDVADAPESADSDFFQTVDLRTSVDSVAEAEEANADTAGPSSDSDSLYEAAEALVIEEQKATQALLQERLRVTTQQAQHLLTLLEAEGVIGPRQVGKSRKVFITYAAN